MRAVSYAPARLRNQRFDSEVGCCALGWRRNAIPYSFWGGYPCGLVSITIAESGAWEAAYASTLLTVEDSVTDIENAKVRPMNVRRNELPPLPAVVRLESIIRRSDQGMEWTFVPSSMSTA